MQHQKLIDGFPFKLYMHEAISEEACLQRSQQFKNMMLQRRSIRHFSDTPVAKEVIENILSVANSAPSGANKQPWTFCAVQEAAIKKIIREEAEREEYESYNGRMPKEWLDDLKPLQTDWHKPFLETAPWLIICFRKSYDVDANGKKKTNYYVQESAGIAVGFLIAAIHNAGLVTLTHTPSPMNFLNKILNRPENEKPFLLLPVGYAADECWVPDIAKKGLDETAKFF